MSRLNAEQISLIVTTYNRPAALQQVLAGLAAQTRRGFKVFVADDGSGVETAALIGAMAAQVPYPLLHIWQADRGFRAGAARNRAVAQTRRDYIIFLDGDCIPPPDFIQRHCQLAEPGWFVAGNRLLCSEVFTNRLLLHDWPVSQWPWQRWLLAWLRRDINRILPLLRLPLGVLRKRKAGRWQGAKTCNLAVWRDDLQAVNGFDERYQGWGHEDADLIVRLLRAGVLRKEGRFAVPVFHLWHAENDRSQEAENHARLAEILDSKQVKAERGLAQYNLSQRHGDTEV